MSGNVELGPIPRLLSGHGHAREAAEQAARRSQSIGAKIQDARCFYCIVDAYASGPPAAYEITVLTGAAEADAFSLTGVLGTSDDVQFSIGDRAVVLLNPGEPARLIAGGGAGGSGGRLYETGVWGS